MEKVLQVNKLLMDELTGLPNFFEFIEADVRKVFGKTGTFIVFNVLNLKIVNETCGTDIGDLCIKIMGQSILNVISKYSNISAYRFGLNDFITVLPDDLHLNQEDIVNQIENEFRICMDDLGFTSIKAHNLGVKYNQEIQSVEDFYNTLLNEIFNQSKTNNDKYISERLLKHTIETFMRNVKNTLAYYNNAYDLALTDDISGLPNHRAGKAYLYNLIGECKSNKAEISILFIDGDNLRRYNKISYKAGNEIISKLSYIIKGSIRSEDKAYRWLSGDEFLIVLKGTDGNKAVKLAERVKEAVENQTKECIYPTTVSIGIATYPSDGDNIEEIISKAEKANSSAKNAGKNKVIKWDNSMKDL